MAHQLEAVQSAARCAVPCSLPVVERENAETGTKPYVAKPLINKTDEECAAYAI